MLVTSIAPFSKCYNAIWFHSLTSFPGLGNKWTTVHHNFLEVNFSRSSRRIHHWVIYIYFFLFLSETNGHIVSLRTKKSHSCLECSKFAKYQNSKYECWCYDGKFQVSSYTEIESGKYIRILTTFSLKIYSWREEKKFFVWCHAIAKYLLRSFNSEFLNRFFLIYLFLT